MEFIAAESQEIGKRAICKREEEEEEEEGKLHIDIQGIVDETPPKKTCQMNDPNKIFPPKLIFSQKKKPRKPSFLRPVNHVWKVQPTNPPPPLCTCEKLL